jgi:3-isopropylmalate/(R)-2-methylmalate dehydratase small subunit
LIELPSELHAKLVGAGTGASVSIDLPAQTVLLNGETLPFEINAVTKDALVKGLDLIGTTLEYEGAIERYEQTHDNFAPTSVL